MDQQPPQKDDPSLQQLPVCPPSCCITFDNPVRRLFQNPYKILRPYIKPGWTILDVGPGMGYFTIPMAKMAGDTGKVIAADIQPEMLEGVRRKATKESVSGRIKLHQSKPESLDINEAIDFCLTFWMVHEVPDRQRFLGEIVSLLKAGGLLLIVEPKVHVSKKSFEATISIAKGLGLTIVSEPKIFISYAALLKKTL
jgi:ubiquinone/menaquinone biosynthesis C-methylase UbiE